MMFTYFNRTDSSSSEHLNVELQHSMRLFRAQRNFYISGFSIFLTLVIRRLVILISSQAQLLAQSEASMRQAQSATTAARSLLSQQKSDEKSGGDKKDAKSDELVSIIKPGQQMSFVICNNVFVDSKTELFLPFSRSFACD